MNMVYKMQNNKQMSQMEFCFNHDMDIYKSTNISVFCPTID